MRHRIDISPQARLMLKNIAESLGKPNMALSTLAEMCIQSAYENVINGDLLKEDLNPIQTKLDEIYTLLQELMPEV